MAAIPVDVIVMTRNAADTLARCLDPLGDFSAVFVVDSASSDTTPAIARQYGARYVPYVWDGRYPKKKQWCLDNLPFTGDWVLYVDSDEIARPEFLAALRGCDFACDGYFVPGQMIWQGRTLRHGLQNRKLSLLNRHLWAYPPVDDLELPGMGEVEGHYQPQPKPAPGRAVTIGSFRVGVYHDAAVDRAAWDARHRDYAAWEIAMTRRGAWPCDPSPLRERLKRAYRRMPLRGAVMFAYCYVLKGGFLDGAAGFDYACARARYAAISAAR